MCLKIINIKEENYQNFTNMRICKFDMLIMFCDRVVKYFAFIDQVVALMHGICSKIVLWKNYFIE